MQIITLSTFFSLIALPFALTLALPTNSSANTTITPPSRYYLKTVVLNNGNADKNNLYVSSYHTGPFHPFPSPPFLPFPSVVRKNNVLCMIYYEIPSTD